MTLSTEEQIFMWAVLAIFNVATIKMLSVSISQISIKDAVAEKDPSLVPKQIVISSTDLSDASTTTKESSLEEMTSYSRISGMIGAIVLAAFLWGLGNIVLYKAIKEPTAIPTILNSVSTFFFAGAALFAPYAINQLRAAFTR